jgi:outer membrane receptor protein involved in Fe transport
MMRECLSFTQIILRAAICLLAVASPLCVAQSSSSDLADASLEQLGTVKVYTASKHLQSGADAPSSVTVVTADEIQRHGYRTVVDVLRSARGFFVTYDRNYSSLGVRGFARPGDYNTRVLLLVDGHRLNDNLYDEAMLGTEFPIDINLIQQIEIIRGPASSLYGSNALFAVINVITKRGQDLDGLEVSAEAGSFNSYKGRMSYGRKLHSLEFLVSGSFYGSKGANELLFSQFNTPQTNNGIASHADDDQVGGGLMTASYRNFTLQAVYGTREKGIPTGGFGTLFNNPGTRTTDAHDYIDLRFDRTLGKGWNILARGFVDRYTYQGTYEYQSASDPAQTTPNLDFGDGKWWGTEVQVSKTFFSQHRITAGSEYRDNFRQNQFDYDLNPFTSYLDDRRQSFVAAGYFQDELTISKSLVLNAGFRYDYYSHLDSSFDPRAALIYRPWTQTAFKVIYGQAFRAPNVSELYYSAFPILPNPALKSEKIHTGELAWEQGVSRHVWFSTSMFYTRMNGLITTEPVPPDFQIYRNLQDVNSVGVEEEIRGQLSNGLEGSISYTFQETEDLNDRLLSNSPRHLVKLSLSQPLFRNRLFVTADGQYRSGIESLLGEHISPYSVVNATVLSRKLGRHTDLSASVYNLLDKKYFDPPSNANLQMPIQQDGRNARVSLTWHWGER